MAQRAAVIVAIWEMTKVRLATVIHSFFYLLVVLFKVSLFTLCMHNSVSDVNCKCKKVHSRIYTFGFCFFTYFGVVLGFSVIKISRLILKRASIGFYLNLCHVFFSLISKEVMFLLLEICHFSSVVI